MRISHKYRFVFLSKPKCGSESVRAHLNRFSDIRSRQTYPFYHHTPLAPLRRHFESVGWDWSQYFVFTTVRHPFTMLPSLYEYGLPDDDGSFWWERHWGRVLKNKVVTKGQRRPPRPAAFRDWVLTHDLSRFTLDPFIYDEAGNMAAHAVLRLERLHQEFAPVAKKLSIKGGKLPYLNYRKKKRRIDFSVYDAEMVDRISKVFATDIAVGGYALSIAPATDPQPEAAFASSDDLECP